MDNLTNDALNDAYPVAAWTWRDGQGGLFSTEIFANGQVRQKREQPLNQGPNAQKMGAISETQVTMFLAHCRAVLNAKPANSATPTQETPEGETYELTLAESANQKSSRQVPRAALSTDVALDSIRREVLGVRKKVYRRWNFWTSAGARWFFLTTAITLALGLYMALDMKHDSQLQARAQQMTGTVLERAGVPFNSEFLTVKLEDKKGAPPVKISKYLSHPHWAAATVGSKVDVLYDAQSNQAWLTSDLLRWQHDKKTIWIFPGFLLLTAFIGLAWLRRYQIGVYDNGVEYMIYEDRVFCDDTSAEIERSREFWYRMFV